MFNDWEMREVQLFNEILNSNKIATHNPDAISWKGDCSGFFSVKAYSNEMEGICQVSSPSNIMWYRIVPSKIAVSPGRCDEEKFL